MQNSAKLSPWPYRTFHDRRRTRQQQLGRIPSWSDNRKTFSRRSQYRSSEPGLHQISDAIEWEVSQNSTLWTKKVEFLIPAANLSPSKPIKTIRRTLRLTDRLRKSLLRELSFLPVDSITHITHTHPGRFPNSYCACFEWAVRTFEEKQFPLSKYGVMLQIHVWRKVASVNSVLLPNGKVVLNYRRHHDLEKSSTEWKQ